MPQFGFYPSQIFWLLICFAVLFIAMKYFLLPPIEAVLKQREDKMKDILRQADKLSSKAEQIEKAYQQYIDKAYQYAAQVSQTAHDEIAADYATQEERLLKTLRKDTKKVEQELKAQDRLMASKRETIIYNFAQIVLHVLYRIKRPEKTLQAQVEKYLKE
mgnify:CR=1 FL=1